VAVPTPPAGVGLLPLAEAVPGLKGVGYSVFGGHTPEPFDAEVLGVWRNIQPGTSYILARLTGHDLERTGVIGGMSGSPVYFDGRLAGAVAFSWPFANEAIAGITPIEEMRRLTALPEAEGAASVARSGESATAAALRRLVGGPLDAELLLAPWRALAAGPVEGAHSGVQWVASGLPESTRALLAERLGPIAPAGEMAEGGGQELRPGSPIAAVLVDGDLRIAASGTVTDIEEGRLLAFGHPFLGLGAARFPMAEAEIVTVVSSSASSFKISNLGPIVGAFTQDQAAGIAGRLGLEARMVPIELVVAGESERELSVRVADVPFATPSLVATALLAALGVDPAGVGSQAIDLEFALDLGERGRLEMGQSFDGPSAPLQSALYLLAVTGYLAQNPFAEAPLRGVEVRAETGREPRTARLVGAHASRSVVRPGERIELKLDFAAYRGARFRRSLALEVPTDLPEGRYSLLVGDGVSIDGARLAIERSDPVTFRQALRLLRSLHSRRSVVVLGLFLGPGLAVAGEVLPQLPGSIGSLWVGAATGTATPLQLAVAQQEQLDLEIPVEGALRVDLEVKRREPLAPRDEPGGEPTEGESSEGDPSGREGDGSSR
jgi:hypothetical protein